MACMNLQMPGPLPGLPGPATPTPANFRSPTLSPRPSRHEVTPPHLGGSPLVGPSRRSQLAFPSYEPVHIGSVPMPGKAPSFTGPPPSRSNTGAQLHEPRISQIHSPRMPVTPQMQRTPPASTHSLQPPMQGAGQASSRFPAPGAPGAPAISNEEVLVFQPSSYTPRPAQPPPVASMSSGPRRATGGSQHGALQPVTRQFGGNLSPNLSPRVANREMKLSIVGDQNVTPPRSDLGDKENNRDNVIQMEYMNVVKENRDALVAKLQEANTQQSMKLAQNEQALEKTTLAQRKAEALHEQLRLDLHEAQLKAKQKDAIQQELEKQIKELQQDKKELRQDNQGLLQDNKGLQESCTMLEYQSGELNKRLHESERQQGRSISKAEMEKRTELEEKDQHLHLLQCQMHDKDVQLQEMDRLMREKDQAMREKDMRIQELERFTHEQDLQLHKLQEMECHIHDKDQTLQQMKHEHQKQDAAKQHQLRDLMAELEGARQQRAAELEAVRAHAEQEVTGKLVAYKEKDEKESRSLRQKVQDSKAIIENLESQLRRTAGAASIITPGEFLRNIKSSEAKNGSSLENAGLVSRNAELESEALLIRKEIALLRHRLPTEVVDALSREAAAAAVIASNEDGRAQEP